MNSLLSITNLSWSSHVSTLRMKGQKRPYFWRKLQKAKSPVLGLDCRMSLGIVVQRGVDNMETGNSVLIENQNYLTGQKKMCSITTSPDFFLYLCHHFYSIFLTSLERKNEWCCRSSLGGRPGWRRLCVTTFSSCIDVICSQVSLKTEMLTIMRTPG